MLNVCDDCTGNAFRNRDAYDFDNRYCPSSGGIFAVHTPIIATEVPRNTGHPPRQLESMKWRTDWSFIAMVLIALASTYVSAALGFGSWNLFR